MLELVAEDTTAKGQNVKITNKAEDYYVIKYKIGEEENNWTEIKSGEKVEVPYGKTIYAKLFYGSSSGVEFKLKIGESNPSIVAKEIDTSNMKRKTDNTFADLFDITWGSEGTGNITYEVTGNILFSNTSYSNLSIENTKELELGTYNVKCTITSPSGYTTSAQKQVKINQLANTTVTNESGSNVNANAIYSEYDLAYFRDLVNSSNQVINAKLIENINMANVCKAGLNWVPISNEIEGDLVFKGIFEGNNKTISGLYINTSNNNQGLFGVNRGEIRNVKINGEITGGEFNVGGIVGVNYKKVSNCHNNASVNGAINVGGVVGYSIGGEIIQCSNFAKVNCSNANVGGILGNLQNSKNSSGIVKNCYNKGAVTATNATAGGIVGYTVEGNVYNCYNVGQINSTIQVGGISGVAGIDNGTIAGIYNCYNLGSITGNASVNNITGGWVVGKYQEINCYSTNATVAGLNSGAFSGNVWVADKNPKINNGYPILNWQ